MRTFILVAGLCSAIALPSWAADPVPGPAPKISANATEQVQALIDKKLTYEDVSTEVKEAIDAVANVRSADRAGRLTAILAALAVLFKLLLSAVKALGGFTFWGARQSHAIRLVTLLMAVSVYCTGTMLVGVPWWEALFLSLSGPGAMVVHEYSAFFGLKKKAGA